MNIVSSTQKTTISLDADLVTLVNVFKVEPKNQQQLVDMLVDATEEAMAKLPGFISANIHKSLDGEWVTNYAQWKSVEDFRAIFQNPTALEHMPKIGAIAPIFSYTLRSLLHQARSTLNIKLLNLVDK